jgi:hypothetical protein
MIRNTLSRAILIITMLFTAGWPSVSYAQPCSANNFADAVQVLRPGYNGAMNLIPPASSDIYGSLGSLKNTAPYDVMWKQISDAFDLAKNRFQKKLCALAGTYIDPSSDSWGFRNPNDLHRYIGLSLSLWQNGTAPPFSAFETHTLEKVLYFTAMPWPSSKATAPRFLTAMSNGTSVDLPSTTVLAALAHEYGHVLWADLVKIHGGINYSYDPKKYCANKTDGFFAGSWATVIQPTFYQTFAQATPDQNLNRPNIPDLMTAINNASASIGNSSFPAKILIAAQKLDQFYDKEYDDNNNPNYRAGVWASLFGALSPEEDFVESFKFYILVMGSSVKITNMPLYIYTDLSNSPVYTPDIYADYDKQPGGGNHPRKDKLLKKVKKCLHADTNW